MLVLALLAIPMLAMSATAESLVDEDIVLSDLIPFEVDGNFDATDCEAKINKDGSMTITITGAAPVLNIKLAEGTLLHTGADVDVTKPAFVAVDFGTAGSIQFTHMIIHYTRKDKDAAGTFADLYLNSMCDANYAQHRKQLSDPGYVAGSALVNGGNYYSVWDWGTYVNADGKVFDDGMHHFVDMVINLTGSTVGSQVTFYTIAVVSDPEVELGTVTPEPIEPEDPETSDTTTDEPESSDTTTDEPEESSAVEESSTTETTSEASSATSSTNTSSATSSTATSSTATSSNGTSSAVEEGGLGTGAIVGIIIAVVVVIGGAVAAIVIVRKKK